MLEIPDQFSVVQRWLTRTFDIETSQSKLGVVYPQFFSLGSRYDFYDSKAQFQATAKERFFALGKIIDVMDARGNLLGIVKKHFLASTFEIFSVTGDTLAIADLNFWKTTYSVQDPMTSAEMALISRPYFRLKDDWSFKMINRKVFQKKIINPLFFIVLMVFLETTA